MTSEVHSDTEKESVEASFLFNLNVNLKHFFLIMDTVIIMVHLNDFRSALWHRMCSSFHGKWKVWKRITLSNLDYFKKWLQFL